MTITIVGWTSDDKVPAVVGETKFGQGRVSVGAAPFIMLVTGNKIAAGSATADQDIDDVPSDDDADDLYGAGSEIAMQCYAARLGNPNVTLKGAPVAEAAGTAASLTITIAGSWTASGSLGFYIGRWYFSVATAADVTGTADNIVSAINGEPRCFCTAAKGAGPGYVVTLTVRNKGPRGNNFYVKKVQKDMPTGMTCTLAGGTPTGSGLVPFNSGATADSATNVIALLKSEEYDIICPGQYDSTNAQAYETHVDSEAGPLIGHLEQVVFGQNGAYSDAQTLAQTNLNSYRCQVLWSQYDRAHPLELAACFGAIRSVIEQTNPNYNYDDVVVPVSTGHEPADVPLHSEKKTALNNGVTPITSKNGDGVIVRSICSHSLNGTSPDYRALDTSDISVPDRIRKELVAEGEAARQANPYVDDNPDSEDPPRPAGVLTPDLWNAKVIGVLKQAEANLWISSVDDNLPTSEWDSTAKRILTACPVVVTPKNHQIGISVRQQAS